MAPRPLVETGASLEARLRDLLAEALLRRPRPNGHVSETCHQLFELSHQLCPVEAVPNQEHELRLSIVATRLPHHRLADSLLADSVLHGPTARAHAARRPSLASTLAFSGCAALRASPISSTTRRHVPSPA